MAAASEAWDWKDVGRGGVEQPAAVEPSPAAGSAVSAVAVAWGREEDGPVFCNCCRLWLNGHTQWEDHLRGKKHKKSLLQSGKCLSFLNGNSYADTIEQVTAEEAAALSRAMDVEMTLADALANMHNDQDGTEAQKDVWTPERAPWNGRPCRVLGRSPTEAECPPLKMQKLDSAADD